ncbi:MAG: hypothetical protein ACI8PZ_004110 [Myxococcota bacterium]
MPDLYARALEIADALRPIPGIRLLPDPPHTPMFHLFLELDPAAAFEARDRVAREHGLWLFSHASAGVMPGTCAFEWYVGEAAMGVPVDAIEAAFVDLLSR